MVARSNSTVCYIGLLNFIAPTPTEQQRRFFDDIFDGISSLVGLHEEMRDTLVQSVHVWGVLRPRGSNTRTS